MNKKIIPISVLCLLSLVACGGNNNPTPSKQSTPTPSVGPVTPTPSKPVTPSEEPVTFTFDDYARTFDIHTEGQRNYFLDPNYDNIQEYTGSGVRDESKSEKYHLSWKTSREIDKTKVVISSKEDLSNSFTYEVTSNSVDFSNLLMGNKYYVQLSYEQYKSDVISFETSMLGMRNMNIATLSNFRDLGGIKLDNGNIKQGMIFRSAELNESYETTSLLSEDDIKLINNEIKIRSEIDLRKNEVTDKGQENGGITSSILGEGVKYVSFPMVYGGSNILTNAENKENIREFFEYLGNKDNYPVVFHCAQGKDRTGCMAYLIEALLGADEDIMVRDYLFTNFSDINGICKSKDILGMNRYGYTLANYEDGETLKEKTYNYLVNEIGVSKESLDLIKSLLVA